MALRPWLADTFRVELLLGNNWLQQKNRAKQAGSTKELHRAWEGLYRDNGSCLDITNTLDSTQKNALRVVQARGHGLQPLQSCLLTLLTL